MYFELSQSKHVFTKLESSKLLSLVPLCAKTIILFCDDCFFYHYSLLDEKILYQSKLPGRPLKTISISDHEILMTIAEKRSLMLLDIRKQELIEISKLPHASVYNEGKEKDIFTQTTLHCFQNSNSFYVQEPRSDQNKTRISYLPKINTKNISVKDFVYRQFDNKKEIIKKVDQVSSFAIYRQEPQENSIFKFKVVDCSLKNMDDIQYTAEHRAFTPFAIVRDIRKISYSPDDRFLIFVNAKSPEILLFNKIQTTDYPYKPNKMFLMTILINIQIGFGMYLFMPDPVDKETETENVLEMVSLNGKVLNSKKCTVNQMVKSWEDDYFIFYNRQNKAGTTSHFVSSHMIRKKTMYMKMIEEMGMDFSPNFTEEIFNLL